MVLLFYNGFETFQKQIIYSLFPPFNSAFKIIVDLGKCTIFFNVRQDSLYVYL